MPASFRAFVLAVALPIALFVAGAALADPPLPEADLLPSSIGTNIDSYALYDAAEFTAPNDAVVVHRGRHWHGSIKMDPNLTKTASNADIWANLKPKLLAAGWTPILEQPTQPLMAVSHYERDGHEAWIEVSIYYYGSASFDEVEAGSAPRIVTINPLATSAERVTDQMDFPYLPPLPGPKRGETSHDPHPMMVTLPGSDKEQAVGAGSTTKTYGAPPGMSTLEFVTAYEGAMKGAGWNIVHMSQGIHQTDAVILGHYAANGRELWAYMHATPDTYSIQVADVGGAASLARDLAKQCHVALYGVLFDFNKATPKPESGAVLQRVADMLVQSPTLKVEVQGHTDNVGTASYNQTLSEARARSVRAWLVAHGVAADRLTAKGLA